MKPLPRSWTWVSIIIFVGAAGLVTGLLGGAGAAVFGATAALVGAGGAAWLLKSDNEEAARQPRPSRAHRVPLIAAALGSVVLEAVAYFRFQNNFLLVVWIIGIIGAIGVMGFSLYGNRD